jgi:hypothetical protein
MNWNQIKHHWELVSDQVRLTWGAFSNEDLAGINGDRARFILQMERRYGYSLLEAGEKIDSFASRQIAPRDTADSVSRYHALLTEDRRKEMRSLEGRAKNSLGPDIK